MLFRKKIEPSCTYCAQSMQLDEEKIFCRKKGIRPPSPPCWRFRYDPCKRIPAKPKALDFSKYDGEDFSL